MERYCNEWKLEVNSDKTKIAIFGNRRANPDLMFKFGDNNLEVVNSFRYLGVTFSYNGGFAKAKLEIKSQATRAMFSLVSKCRKLKLPIDTQLELFDSTVLPIMLYGAEVWGQEKIDVLEKLHLKFLKYVLNVNSRTCNNMVYGELGRFPIYLSVKLRMLSYWCSLLTNRETKLSKMIYDSLLNLFNRNEYCSTWIASIKNLLDDCGLSEIWNSQSIVNTNWLKNKVKQVLQDQFIQKWRSELNNMTSCDTYVNFKEVFELEKYLINLHDMDAARNAICKIRCNNSRIPKVVGRYRGIPRDQRICQMCAHAEAKVGDEYHVLLECSHPDIVRLRENYIHRRYYVHPNMFKCLDLLTCRHKSTTKRLGLFLNKVLKYFR